MRNIWGLLGHTNNGPPPFTPKSLSGLKWWSRSDLGIHLSGSNLTTWDDQSTAGVISTIPSAGSNIVYSASGGVKSLPFLTGAAGCTLTTATSLLTSGSDRTIFVASRQTSLGLQGACVAFKQASAVFNCNLADIGGTLYVYSDGTSNDTVASFPDMTVINYATWTGSVGSLPVVRINGSAMTVAGGNSVTSDTGVDGFSLMAEGAGLSFVGEYYEAIVYSRVLTGPEITQVEAYLSSRYT